MNAPTILTSLLANTEEHPDKLLYAFHDVNGRATESYRYQAFVQRTADIASHIHRTTSLLPGERVLLVYPPGIEMICAFFACVRLGLIPVPVYPPSSHGFTAALHRMNFIAQDCQAGAVLTDRSYYWSMKLHRARASIAGLSLKADYTSSLRWIVTTDAEANAREGFPEAHSEILFLQYTSGSTTNPRGVMVSHDNVLSNCDTLVDHTPVGVCWLPQYHDLGLIAFYMFVAIKGGTTYGFSPLDFIQRPQLWLETMSRVRATASAAPNFAYEYCLRPDKVDPASLEGLDLSALRLLMSGAEPIRPAAFSDFRQTFRPYGLDASCFTAAYGLAEYTLAVSGYGTEIRSFNRVRMAADEVRPAETGTSAEDKTTLISCGRPLGETVVSIVDTAGGLQRADEGRVGEIWVDGPSKCLGYWGRPELSEEVFHARFEGGNDRTWLRTGDLGFIHDGELFICGRAKDVIIVRGLNYYPQDIEALVEEDDAIRKGCVAAFAAETPCSEGVVVVAELKSRKRRPDSDALTRNILQRLGVAVDSFVYVRERTLPKTSSGKIVRHLARLHWEEERLEVIEQIETATPLTDRSVEAHGRHLAPTPTPLGQVFGRYGLTGAEHRTLGETGLDSLAMAEFARDLERHLEARGAGSLAAAVDIRWLHKIVISELFHLLQDVSAAKPRAKLRFSSALVKLRTEQREMEHDLMRHDVTLGGNIEPTSALSHETGSSADGILLTGGTGFFGPFLLSSLLEQCEGPIYVLVRARDTEHGTQRLREGLAKLNTPGAPMAPHVAKDWEHRVIPICGDITQPRLGTTPADWARLSEQVHTIYHNGALVNYLLDYSAMRPSNVGATTEVVRLASSKRVKVVNHISTTFVFGWSTRDTLFETDCNHDMELLDFGYSQSKWVSEQIVLNAIKEGLPARVFRPALIAPSVEGGGHNFDITIRLLAFMLKYGISTTARNQVSFSPADLVANNVVAISNLQETVGKTFHVTRDDFSSMLDITAMLSELTGVRFENHTLKDFVPNVIERCQKDDLLFPLLNFLVRSVDNISAMEFKRYDNRSYQEARAQSPFGRRDPPLVDVVGGIVRFMRRHGLVADQPQRPLLERA
ncbi:MAG: AMP-binding protein [Longimicrobiales bacterium]